MHEKFIRLLFIAAAFALVAGAAAPSYGASQEVAAASSSPRIGYVDFTRALNEVSDGKQAKKRLRGEFKEKQERLNLMQSELTKMQEDIEHDKLILSSEEIKAKEEAYRQKLMDVQRRFADFRREMTEREASLTEEILGRLRKIVRSIGESEGYALILERSQEVVLYAPTGEDLTEKVIKEYNRKSK